VSPCPPGGPGGSLVFEMTFTPEATAGITRVGPFASFYQRFEDLIASSCHMVLYFIHSRRWRENHDAAMKAFLGRSDTTLEIFLPDLENHELMFSLSRRFQDGSLTPTLVVDAYRYCARLAREYGKPGDVWLFGRYPAYSFYQFDQQAILALYSNTAAKKDIPAFEVSTGGMLGKFLAGDIDDLKRECRRRTPNELEALIDSTTES
jgi:hypothetical protein